MLKKLLTCLIGMVISTMGLANGGSFIPTDSFHHFVSIIGGYAWSFDTSTQLSYNHLTENGSVATNKIHFNNDIGSGELFGAQFGHIFNSMFSADLEYFYRGNFSWDKSFTLANSAQPNQHFTAHDITIQTIMVNTAFSPVVWHQISPFVNAGAGFAWNRIGNITSKSNTNNLPGKNTTNFAWKLGVGADYALTQTLHVVLGDQVVSVGRLSSDVVTSIGAPSVNLIQKFKTNRIYLNESYIAFAYRFP